jgi:hypothetical protein
VYTQVGIPIAIAIGLPPNPLLGATHMRQVSSAWLHPQFKVEPEWKVHLQLGDLAVRARRGTRRKKRNSDASNGRFPLCLCASRQDRGQESLKRSQPTCVYTVALEGWRVATGWVDLRHLLIPNPHSLYFPIQNRLKMRSSTDSVTSSPVTSPNAPIASRRSIVQKSRGSLSRTVIKTCWRAVWARISAAA